MATFQDPVVARGLNFSSLFLNFVDGQNYYSHFDLPYRHNFEPSIGNTVADIEDNLRGRHLTRERAGRLFRRALSDMGRDVYV